MKTLRVNTARAYDILVGRGLLEQAGALSREVNGGSRALIVTDSHVFPLYAGAAAHSFEEAGYQTAVFTFPPGRKTSGWRSSRKSTAGWRSAASPARICWWRWAGASRGI